MKYEIIPENQEYSILKITNVTTGEEVFTDISIKQVHLMQKVDLTYLFKQAKLNDEGKEEITSLQYRPTGVQLFEDIDRKVDFAIL